MVLSADDSQKDRLQYVFYAKMDNSNNISHLLKAISFKENAMCFASENGLKVTVEDFKCVQANAFVQSTMFQDFVIKEENVTFKVNLNVLVECLNIFGGGANPGTTPSLKICYAGYGTPLKLLLEEGGVLTDCSIQTQEAEEILEFNFSGTNVVNKVIVQADCLREVFNELDPSSENVQLLLSPDPPHFRISTFGNSGDNHVEIPQTSEVFEAFQCTATAKASYKLAHLKPSAKPLALSQKVSVRMDDRGFLCMQYLIKTEDNHTCFVEFYCAPNLEDDDDR